jgi:hypothetical protein
VNIESLASNLIVAAFEKGVRIDMEYAKQYISARELLQRDPNNEGPLAKVEHFELLMSDFGRFTLPLDDYTKHCGDPDAETDEEYRERRCAHFSLIPPQDLVAKCSPYFRPHAEIPYWREGIMVFIERTGLTVEKIRAMTPAELAPYA